MPAIKKLHSIFPLQAAGFFCLLAAFMLVLPQTVPAQDAGAQREPEAATGLLAKPLVSARRHMIVAANPLAARAGLEILRRGGNAIDAAIAAQMVLGLVEPQSSGIGGGAFLLHWDETRRELRSYDGRETAPMAADEGLFLDADGKPLSFAAASRGGLGVGVPGLLKVLELAHQRHGALPWPELFSPAIALAREGFRVSPRLHELIGDAGIDAFGPNARAYFFDPSGAPRQIGYRLRNEELAQALEQIAARGADVFYTGEIARSIVGAIRGAARPGRLALEDLAAYEARERVPICTRYRDFRVCGMGPPSSGGLTIAQVLGLIEPFDLSGEPLRPESMHLVAEALKLAFADRAAYMADADKVDVPGGLLDEAYIASRRRLIGPEAAGSVYPPGDPPGAQPPADGDARPEAPGTTHVSVIDERGNAVVLTSSIERAFGSGLMVKGFLLNNQLTDFSFIARDATGRPIANRVSPGKRPRSSMAPTIVFKDGDVHVLSGSPGGVRIIPYVLKSLLGVLDWGLDPQRAVALPGFATRGAMVELEAQAGQETLADALREYGHEVRLAPMTSGIHMILRRGAVLEAGVDPRREGHASGD